MGHSIILIILNVYVCDEYKYKCQQQQQNA